MLPSITTRTHVPGLPIDPGQLPRRSYRPPVQLGLFWEKIRFAHLVAIDHPRPVYYDIWLERNAGRFRVRKASGAEGNKPNVCKWEFDNLEDARKEFTRRLNSKISLKRNGARRYVMGDREK